MAGWHTRILPILSVHGQAPASSTCFMHVRWNRIHMCAAATSGRIKVRLLSTCVRVCACTRACLFMRAHVTYVISLHSAPASQRYVRGMLSPPALSALAIFNSSYYTTILSITVIINLSWLLDWCNVLTSDVETTLWLLKFGWELSHTDIDDVSGGNWELKTLWFMSL